MEAILQPKQLEARMTRHELGGIGIDVRMRRVAPVVQHVGIGCDEPAQPNLPLRLLSMVP